MKRQGVFTTNMYTKPKNAYQNTKNTFMEKTKNTEWRTVITQRKEIYMGMGQIYKDVITFRKENLSRKRKEDILEKKLVCE